MSPPHRPPLADGTTSDDTGLDDYKRAERAGRSAHDTDARRRHQADGQLALAGEIPPHGLTGDTRRIWASGEVYLEVARMPTVRLSCRATDSM